ncbi:putative membrane protein [Mycobacterium sp. BK086]|uniref:sulfatase n=1 Tax=Mycobacterium sp. BK086 TaxID=2512165 RepID=UPI00105C7AD0|nr:sulfatase [Mycobacterium sp. BK086]TDO18527.1 putative membrane protein [Mycobacterium sp. BK086]
MDDDHQLVVVAAYADLDEARTDFNELGARIKHGMELRAAALVGKDDDGQAKVVEAQNRHGRTAIGVGAGLGLLLGLFLPPFGLSVLVGGASAGVIASIAEHELRTGLRREIGEALEAGTGVVIAVVYPNGRMPVEITLSHAASFRALRMDTSTINSIEEAVADAMAAAGHPVSAGTKGTSR